MARKRAGRGVARDTDPAYDSETAKTAVHGPDACGRSDANRIGQARQSLMEAVPQTATALAKEAMDGSLPHIKLLLQLVGLDDGELAPVEIRPREKTREEIDMEAWNREP